MKRTRFHTAVRQALRQRRDPAVTEGAERYFKYAIRFIGVKAPGTRAVSWSLWPMLRERPVHEVTREACLLLRSPFMEERQVGVDLLWRARGLLPATVLGPRQAVFDEVVEEWGTCDAIAGRVLRPASFSRMVQRTVRAPELGEDAFYGLGLVLGSRAGDPVFWHSGGMPGYRSMLLGDQDEGLGVVVMMNGPGNPRRIAEYALDALVRARRHQPMLPVPVAPDPALIPEAGRLAGVYSDTGGATLTFVQAEDRLFLDRSGTRVAVLRIGPAEFYADDSTVAPFPLRFRTLSADTVELVNGGRWYRRGGRPAPGARPPPEWLAYPGHYRAQVPYFSNYRVVVREGALLLLTPEGYEETLVPLGQGEFRVGQDARSPERLRFGEIVSGRALRLNLSGTEYYRTTTP